MFTGCVVDRLEIVDRIICIVIIKQRIVVRKTFLDKIQMFIERRLICILGICNKCVKSRIEDSFAVLIDTAVLRTVLDSKIEAEKQQQKAD